MKNDDEASRFQAIIIISKVGAKYNCDSFWKAFFLSPFFEIIERKKKWDIFHIYTMYILNMHNICIPAYKQTFY